MNLSMMRQRELRHEQMARRRRCKKLHRVQAWLAKELDLASKAFSENNPAAAEHMAELLYLSKKAATLMQVFQIDAWEARDACEQRGIRVPTPHRSEGKGFRGTDSKALASLRADLEAEGDADAYGARPTYEAKIQLSLHATDHSELQRGAEELFRNPIAVRFLNELASVTS